MLTALAMVAAHGARAASVRSDATRWASDDGAVEGYRFLNNRPGKVAWLGPAFFTKWLYFITAWVRARRPPRRPCWTPWC